MKIILKETPSDVTSSRVICMEISSPDIAKKYRPGQPFVLMSPKAAASIVKI